MLGAVAAALVVGVAACEQRGGEQAAPADAQPLVTTAADSSVAGASAIEDPNSELPDGWETATTAAEPTTTLPPVDKVPLGRTLSQGTKGDDVLHLQERLVELGFDPGKPDGYFGPATTMAVWAFEKLVLGSKPNATIGPEDWEVLFGDVQIAPRRPNSTATHFEVYLPEQTAVLFVNNQARLVTHVSTGDNQEWCSEEAGRCGTSITPGGVFKFYRRQSDWWEGSLGKMYNPVYFNYGVAVHGMTSVPNYPASHGCVRIPMHVAEYFPDLVSKGDVVYVWDGVKEPEAYGAQPPPFDRPDPNATTTTIAPSTTVPKTTTTTKATTTAAPTTAPPTTVPPTTVAPTTVPPTTVPPTTVPPTTLAPTTAPPQTLAQSPTTVPPATTAAP